MNNALAIWQYISKKYLLCLSEVIPRKDLQKIFKSSVQTETSLYNAPINVSQEMRLCCNYWA